MNPVNAIKTLGPYWYIAVMGLGVFGGWIFVALCFVYSLNGFYLTLHRLEVMVVVSAGVGILWGIGMWYLVLARHKANGLKM
jgi:hypothetical protein